MKGFTNANPRDLAHALTLVQQARRDNHTVAIAGGGSDLLGQIKERLVAPDVVVNLKTIKGLDQVTANGGGVTIGGLTTLDAVSKHQLLRQTYAVLSEAAETVATPQIRNVGTIAGNVCQRPWCWYYRNGFPCLKNGGNTCFSVTGENRFHAIFGGGPSYIVHPSDTAPALVALDAKFRIVGAAGERIVPAGEFFVLPSVDAARETVLKPGEVLASIQLPPAHQTLRSAYHKVMDREAWTHAVVSAAMALDVQNGVCRNARIVLGGVAPIPWRLPKVEQMLTGQRITPELAEAAAQASTAGARPLANNAYKIPMTKAVVRRTLLQLAEKTA